MCNAEYVSRRTDFPPVRVTAAESALLLLLADQSDRVGERASAILAASEFGTLTPLDGHGADVGRAAGKWRAQFQEHRVGGLFTAAPTDADLAAHEQAIFRALDAPGPGSVTAAGLSADPGIQLSQTAISQVWRRAGFSPPPPGVLIADPWFAGRSRTLVGLIAVGRLGSPAGSATPRRVQRVIPGGLIVAAYAVSNRLATGWSKNAERQQLAGMSGGQQVFDEGLAVAQAASRLASRLSTVADEVAAVDALEYLSSLRAGLASEIALHLVATAAPGPVLEAWAVSQPQVVLRHTPTEAVWTALFARSAAATVSMLEARELVSPLPEAELQLRRAYADREPARCSRWADIEDTAAVLVSLDRRPPRASRAAELVPTLQGALRGLRARRSSTFAADLPAFEFLLMLRRRSGDELLGKEDPLAALVVLKDLDRTRDQLEAELIAFTLDVATNSTQSETAPVLGVGSASAVGMRRRRLAAGSPSRRRRARATPNPRERVVLDSGDRRRDVFRDLVDELQARWVDDLVDHEELIEQIPGPDDAFGMIAYVVDPRRHIARHVDPARPTPTQRRQADGKAGLILAADVYHRLLAERAGWYDLAREHGHTWAAIGAAVGKTRSGAYKERRALARASRNGDGRDAGADGNAGVPAFWKDLLPEVQRQITTFAEYADHFANDESITDWLDLLTLTGVGIGRQQCTFFLELVEELADTTDCATCEQPQLPIATADAGERLCIRCHDSGDPALASLLSAAADLRRELIKRRRAAHVQPSA